MELTKTSAGSASTRERPNSFEEKKTSFEQMPPLCNGENIKSAKNDVRTTKDDTRTSKKDTSTVKDIDETKENDDEKECGDPLFDIVGQICEKMRWKQDKKTR